MRKLYECPICGSHEFAIELIDGFLDAVCRNCDTWVGTLNQNAAHRLGEKL